MDLARKPFSFADGRSIELFESTWESSSIRARIEEDARAQRAKLNGSGDPVFFFFVETFYSFMASCSRGDVPGPEEAYTLPDEELDRWYEAIIEVNPESFIKADRSRRGEVSFRDGSRFEIVSSHLLSVTMRRARLEEEGLQREPDRNSPKDVLSVYLYPILASCSIGSLPTVEELRQWPEMEIYKWRDAIEVVNPHLFGSSDELSTQESKEITKKKERRRVKSRASSSDSSSLQVTMSPEK